MLELDPRIAKKLSSGPPVLLRAETLAEMRAASDKPSRPPAGGVERRDYPVDGDPAVAVRVHRPTAAQGVLPCIYSMHGGGYVVGSYTIDDARLEAWSCSYRCVGVSVDYRLAPETPFPGPLDDCYAGLKWVFDHHDDSGSTRSASVSAGPVPERDSRPGWRSWPATAARSPSCFSYSTRR